MKLNDLVLSEIRLYATRVGLHDAEGLARFHQECTPERILAMLERLRELEELVDRFEERQDDLEYYIDRCDDLEEELEARKHES